MSEEAVGCVEPAGGPVGEPAPSTLEETSKEEVTMTPLARVGKEAPDFEAVAFHKGEFKKIKLSDYRGKWVVLCFYPADFTFV